MGASSDGGGKSAGFAGTKVNLFKPQHYQFDKPAPSAAKGGAASSGGSKNPPSSTKVLKK